MPFLRTSIVRTTVSQIVPSPDGLTIGQQIDRRIAEIAEEPGSGRIHEITFGFESDEDFGHYHHRLAQMGEATELGHGKRR